MKKTAYLLVLSLFLLFFSCKKNNLNFASDPNLFKDLIISHTHGLISSHSDIRTILNFEMPEWQPNQELDSDLYTIQPKVKGKVVALNTTTVTFIPEEKLKQDQEYLVSFNIKEIKDVPKELRSFNYVVKTYKQNFTVTPSDLQSYSKNYQYLNMDFQSADRLKVEEVAKLISAKQNGKNLKLKFKSSATAQNNFKFYIDSIQRFEEDSEIEIQWDGKSLDIDTNGETKFSIPGKNTFTVLNIETSEDEDAVLINFSDPVKGNQNFRGLVQLGDVTPNKFATTGNVLKVYYPEQTVGDKKVEIFAGILSDGNTKLKKNISKVVTIGSKNPEVVFVKSGSILPSSNDLKLNFKAINLNAVDVKIYKIYQNNILQFFQDNTYNTNQNLKKVAKPIVKQTIYLNPSKGLKMNRWKTYAVDLSKLITPDPGAIYNVEISFKKSYAALDCNTDEIEESESLKTSDGEVRQYSGYDYDYEDFDYEDYNWNDRDNPCTPSFYNQKSIQTNILASDLGVTVKRGVNGHYTFIVANIITAQPESGAEIKLYNFQQQVLETIKTDGEGFTSIKIPDYAYYAVVTKDKSTTYVKLDEGAPLSLSNFNVDGVEAQNGLKGFVFGERGVWRPGDTLFIGFMLNDLDSKLDKSQAITLRVNDVHGKTKAKQVKTYTESNYYLFKVPTAASDPTGNWEAKISVGGAHFYKSLKVETIKPNRLKIKNSVANKELNSNQSNTVQIAANWLHGATAKNLKVNVQAKLLKGKTEFKGYEKFDFDDEVRMFYGEETNIYSGFLNENGTTSFNYNPSLDDSAPGKIKAIINTKVYEPGGDFSTDVISTTISPYQTYIGVKSPEVNKYGMLETDKVNTYLVQTVSASGKPKAVSNLRVEVYKIEWRWWWNSFEGELSQYNYSDTKTAYASYNLNTNASGKASFNLNVPEQDWGRFLIRVIDPIGGHATSMTSLIDWPIWSGKTKNTGSTTANMLLFTADKEKYNVGETAKISFPSTANAKALISIESGAQVLETMWVDTKQGETVVPIKLSDKMAPNVYVHISLFRPHAQTIDDAPIRMYGVLNLEVTNVNTKLDPVITLPKILKPEENFTLTVKEQAGKPMTYTIAMVDEGLLDLTRFKTPDAWKSFNSRLALGVKTWDVYDDIIGAYGGKVNQIFSIGGDEDLGGGDAKKANRFEPVVRVLGPFTIGKNGTGSHTIKMPNYVGSVRTMVIAGDVDSNSYGSTEVTTPVRKPLMVLASLPRKIAPNEKVSLPVTLFAMENHVKNVNLQIKTSGRTRVSGSSSKSVYFENPDEKVEFFELDVTANEGIEKIEIIATSGSETAKFMVEVDVINPNPSVTRYQDIVVSPNASTQLNFESFGVAGSNKAAIEFSSFPSINLNGRLNYLIQYPHGCIEQITSSAFPQLFIADIFDVDATKKSQMQRNVNATIAKLNNYQLASGGFAYWPGHANAEDWATSYVGHFIVEAEAKGYILPDGMKSKWLSYQQTAAKKWRYNATDYNDVAQSYRLYVLAVAGSADLASMNRLKETQGISALAKNTLAGAYALVNQPQVANGLLSTISAEANYNSYYYGSFTRNQALLLSTYTALKNQTKAFELAKEISKNLASNQYMSTQTTGYSLFALSKFLKQVGAKGVHVNYVFNGKEDKIDTDKSFASRNLEIQRGDYGVKIVNKGKNTLYARVAVSGVLPVGEEQVFNENLNTTVSFKTRKGETVSLDNIKQGSEIIATVTVSNASSKRVDHIALQQIFPSGFEIVNLRYTDFGSSFENKATYTDIRDDRANYYFNLNAGETKTFTTVVNASYLGTYYLPGAYAEDMYNNQYKSRTAGKWIKISADK